MTTPLHVLIVDDDSFQRDFLQVMVQRCFPYARVTTVATGYAALVTYQTDGVDVLILDHWLPDVLGNALVQYLREARIPVPTILMSGVLPRADVVRDARTVFVQKPVLIPELVATVHRCILASHDPTFAV